MKSEDIKVLQFKDDLMKLLKKYKYDITGTNLDNGDIYIDTGGVSYILKDTKDIIKEVFIKDKEYDYEYKNIMKEYILESFKNSKSREMCFGNFSRVSTGIVTDDRNKAKMILDELAYVNEGNVFGYIQGKEELRLILNDKTNYVWIKPTNYARGYRLQNAWIDKNIGLEYFQEILMPICCYCGSENIKVI
jgi:hypothetical protein